MIHLQLLHAQNKNLLIDTLVNYMHDKYQFDGVVLVADSNLVIYKKAFGLANRDWNIENTVDLGTFCHFKSAGMATTFHGYVKKIDK
jgi:hypothetical protein